MSVRVENLEVRTDRTFTQLVQVLTSSGTPRDLTGWSARMSIKRDRDDVAPLLTLTSPGGGLTITPLSGEITITISKVQTAAFTFLSGVYDLTIVQGSDADPILEGGIIVKKSVTASA